MKRREYNKLKKELKVIIPQQFGKETIFKGKYQKKKGEWNDTWAFKGDRAEQAYHAAIYRLNETNNTTDKKTSYTRNDTDLKLTIHGQSPPIMHKLNYALAPVRNAVVAAGVVGGVAYGGLWYIFPPDDYKLKQTYNAIRLETENKELEEVIALNTRGTYAMPTQRKKDIMSILQVGNALKNAKDEEILKLLDPDGNIHIKGIDRQEAIKLLGKKFFEAAREDAGKIIGEKQLESILKIQSVKDMLDLYTSEIEKYELNKGVFKANVEARKEHMNLLREEYVLQLLLPDTFAQYLQKNWEHGKIVSQLRFKHPIKYMRGDVAFTKQDYESIISTFKAKGTLQQAIVEEQVTLQDTVADIIRVQGKISEEIKRYEGLLQQPDTKEQQQKHIEQLEQLNRTFLLGDLLHYQLTKTHTKYVNERAAAEFLLPSIRVKNGIVQVNEDFLQVYNRGIDLDKFINEQYFEKPVICKTIVRPTQEAYQQAEKIVKENPSFIDTMKNYAINTASAGAAALAGFASLYLAYRRRRNK